MMNQLGFEANEIGTEAVAHDGVRGFQFEAGDQLRLDRDLDQNRMSEDSGDRFAASLDFLWGYRTGSRQTDRRAIRAERCPGSLRKLCQSRRDPIDKGGDARLMRQSIEQLAGNIDGKPSRPIVGGERFGAAFGFDLGFGGGAKLVGLGLGRLREAPISRPPPRLRRPSRPRRGARQGGQFPPLPSRARSPPPPWPLARRRAAVRPPSAASRWRRPPDGTESAPAAR